MTYTADYAVVEPGVEAVAAMSGRVALEFGAPWCPHCQAAQPGLAQALSGRREVTHVKVEDGKGRRLGRAFAVKLWPTLVLLRDGLEVARVVRPRGPGDLAEALARWDAGEVAVTPAAAGPM